MKERKRSPFYEKPCIMNNKWSIQRQIMMRSKKCSARIIICFTESSGVISVSYSVLHMFTFPRSPTQGSHSFTDKKSKTFPRLSRTPWQIFQDLLVAHECLNILKKSKYLSEQNEQKNVLNYCMQYLSKQQSTQTGNILLLLVFYLSL